MNRKSLLALALVIVLGAGGAYYLTRHARTPGDDADHAHAHGHGHAPDNHAAEAEGPHGGRLLRDGNFTVELAIVERGIPPEFRAWFTHNGQPLAPANVKLTVTLERPGGATETFTFSPERDYARGSGEVREPHSFNYTVVAEHAGRTHRWTFAAPEMQATLPPELAQRAGVAVETAGPAVIRETLTAYGQIKLDANRTARAVPRFIGLVRTMHKSLGDAVSAGEVLAVLETNDTLATVEVKAPLAGIITERHAQAGETVNAAAPLYTIADLSEVWLELEIPARERHRVRIGQSITLLTDPAVTNTATDTSAPRETISATLAWLSPFVSGDTQTFTARAVLPNSDGRWRPGTFVKANITLAESTVPVAVKEAALQTLFDFTVVFSQHGDVYQARPLTLGRRSDGWIEVLDGLAAGERYVTANSFLLKAEIGKSGATHDH